MNIYVLQHKEKKINQTKPPLFLSAFVSLLNVHVQYENCFELSLAILIVIYYMCVVADVS